MWLLPSKLQIGMALVTKQVVNDCQCKGDKGDALLTIHLISGSILAIMKAMWSAAVNKVGVCKLSITGGIYYRKIISR